MSFHSRLCGFDPVPAPGGLPAVRPALSQPAIRREAVGDPQRERQLHRLLLGPRGDHEVRHSGAGQGGVGEVSSDGLH